MDITVADLKSRLAASEDLILIDVREAHEHEEFNVGGKLVPLGTIPSSIAELQDHKEEEIVIYCRSGQRSGMAQKFLQQYGFTNVRNLEGGMLAWAEMEKK